MASGAVFGTALLVSLVRRTPGPTWATGLGASAFLVCAGLGAMQPTSTAASSTEAAPEAAAAATPEPTTESPPAKKADEAAAAAEDPPGPLLAQLKLGGIMVLPVGQSDHVQTLIRVRKTEYGLEYDELRPVRFVPLLEGLGKEG